MIVEHSEEIGIARIAAAIGEPARTRILYCLLDGHARTATELAIVADVSPSTASVHLSKLKNEGLVKVFSQGKHRYYDLSGNKVADALESLSVLAGNSRKNFVPNTPTELRLARTCYDHIAGTLGVSLRRSFEKLGLISVSTDRSYDLSGKGFKVFENLGIDVDSARSLRRRFAYPCLDWSERQPHLGGSLAAAILQIALEQKWVERVLDSRALEITRPGKREIKSRFGFEI